MATVICCGAATLDTIFRVDRMPTGPGKILPTGMIEVAHGMATSAAAAVARLGGRARLFARVGDDLAGQRFIRDLTAAGVDCGHVRRVAGARSPICTVLVDDTGERLVIPFYDPALGRDPGWLPLDDLRRRRRRPRRRPLARGRRRRPRRRPRRRHPADPRRRCRPPRHRARSRRPRQPRRLLRAVRARGQRRPGHRRGARDLAPMLDGFLAVTAGAARLLLARPRQRNRVRASPPPAGRPPSTPSPPATSSTAPSPSRSPKAPPCRAPSPSPTPPRRSNAGPSAAASAPPTAPRSRPCSPPRRPEPIPKISIHFPATFQPCFQARPNARRTRHKTHPGPVGCARS